MNSLEPLPYYRWLWKDYRSNRKVQRMSWQARGLYRELLDEFWAEGSLPNDMDELADICGCSLAEMQRFWPEIEQHFHLDDDGRWVNSKMDAQRTVMDTQRVIKSRAGKSGGIRKSQLKQELVAPASTAESTASTCHIEEKSREEKSKEQNLCPSPMGELAEPPKKKRFAMLHVLAARCHAAYPRKVAKQESLKAFAKHIALVAARERWPDEQAGAWMAAKVTEYAASELLRETEPDMVPYPASWANAGRYDDPAEEWRGKHRRAPPGKNGTSLGLQFLNEVRV